MMQCSSNLANWIVITVMRAILPVRLKVVIFENFRELCL